jgi:diguanylate cyclase (GGDEF)-like protein
LDWNTLPDLLALTALVAVFFSLLPRRADTTLRLWLAAWVLILVHFAAKFCDGAGTNNPVEFVAFGALDLSGLTFMWAAASPKIGRRQWLVFSAFAIPQLTYFGISIFSNASNAVYTAAAIAGVLIPTAVLASTIAGRRKRILAIGSCFALGAALLLIIRYTPDPTNGVSAILTWLYLNAAILYWRRFPRPTTGAVTTVAGLFVWSLVFPIYLVLPLWAPHVHIDSVAYNIPKYVVAIGIILMLLEEQMERSTFLAKHDELTGLPNRRLLGERLEAALHRAKRGRHKVALLTIDLDRFKAVNDSLGHSAGDELLRIVARRLAARIRAVDTCARLGGDEFIVVAEQLSHRGDGDVVARDLLAILDEPIELCGQRILASASIGVAVFPDDATDAEGLYGISDARMYAVKELHHERESYSSRRSAG